MAKKYFLECCRVLKIPERQLLPFCATRWNTAHDMIERVLLVEKAVKYFLNNADNSNEVPKTAKGQRTYSSYKLSTRQWELLAAVRNVLQVFIIYMCLFLL